MEIAHDVLFTFLLNQINTFLDYYKYLLNQINTLKKL